MCNALDQLHSHQQLQQLHKTYPGSQLYTLLMFLRRAAFRNILIIYSAVCALWIPANFWMMPWHALQIGEVSCI